MALLDEEKLQGRVYEILDTLRKQVQCCRVASAQWMSSDSLGTNVFVIIYDSGDFKVFDAPGGTEYTQAQYGTLKPYTP